MACICMRNGDQTKAAAGHHPTPHPHQRPSPTHPVGVVLPSLVVLEHLQALAVAHGQQGPARDALLHCRHHLVLAPLQEGALGGADVGDLGAAGGRVHHPGALHEGGGQADDVVALGVAQEIVKHEDPCLSVQHLRARWGPGGLDVLRGWFRRTAGGGRGGEGQALRCRHRLPGLPLQRQPGTCAKPLPTGGGSCRACPDLHPGALGVLPRLVVGVLLRVPA